MFTTIEKLAKKSLNTQDKLIRYDEYVFVIRANNSQFCAEIYEFIEHPDTTDKGIVECRLNRIAQSDYVYSDGGHALAWCLDQIK